MNKKEMKKKVDEKKKDKEKKNENIEGKRMGKVEWRIRRRRIWRRG